jgi:cystathionine gamma-synthase
VPLRPQTVVVRAGRPEAAPGQPLNVPIIPSSTFHAVDATSGDGGTARAYSREDGTAGWDALEDTMGQLEGGLATVFASGMAAVSAVLETLPVGARVVLPADCYTGTRALLEAGVDSGRWTLVVVPNADLEATRRALPGASVVWVETPSNPLLDVVELQPLADAAHAQGVHVVCDNTFATPLLQQPLSLGADVVVHSATKYLGGHSDLLLGVTVVRDPQAHAALRRRRSIAGATPGALECFLAQRGIRTLAVRLAAAQANAAALAGRLHAHPAVRLVRYPGLPGHPGHDVAQRQMTGFGAMLSFEVADAATADGVCARLRVIQSATSLGGVESTIERRARLPGQHHLPPGLLRLSVGCEHVEDLWDDLEQALERAPGHASERDLP